MIFKNNNKIKNIYRGTLPISNVYRGGILVYTGEKTYDGLTFEALEPSTILYKPSTVSTAQYSYDAVNWETADNVTLNLNKGDKVYFKGTITGNQTANLYARFTMTGKVSASGSIMSLQAGNPQDKSLNYNYEFQKMFRGCTSLVTAPALPSTELTNHCYEQMFYGCTSLINTPALPATTLKQYCYSNMFNGCTSLANTPNLPAKTLVGDCYVGMFSNCTSIITAPVLPATTLANNCYNSMFRGCTSLVTAPELPATILADICYGSMFSGCTLLTTAPELPATTLAEECYSSMFDGCSKLNYIKAMFTTTPSLNYTENWVNGVASTGTFVKNKDATWNVTGYYGIPEGWTVQIEEWKGLTFTAIEPSTIKYKPSTVSTAQYSYDAVNWETADNVTLNLNTGDKVYFKGTITGEQSFSNNSQFSMTGKVSASGSIMSLQSGNPEDNTFNYNFEFYSMFALCTSLVSTPSLPATSLTESCYENMFADCTSIVNAPDLPSTTLAAYCYCGMFQNCSSLTTAPALPATTLAEGCYYYMFNGCTSLVTAPDLLATTLTTSCYENMFNGCSNLNYIKALFTDTPDPLYTQDWVQGVSATGTFVKNKDATWNVTGYYGIPEGWTVETA